VLNDRATGATPLLLGERTDADGPVTSPPDTGRRPILAARVPADRGEVIVLTVPGVFSNAGLHDRSNARLALSLIGPAGRGQLAFDELHHGFGVRQARSMYALLLEHAWGRTALLAGGVVTVFLILRGRRLGRAVPIFVDRGRSLGELVTSQAGLLRAGGKRTFVADHLERQLRADLTQTIGLPADATDQEIAGRASAMGRDPSSALRALDRTRRARSDRELLAVTREATRAQAELTRATSPPAPSPARRGAGGEVSLESGVRSRRDEERR
jgi:hypothetical protein